MQVKICGVTNPDDAYFAAEAGADFIGVIFAPVSRRVITAMRAREISSAVSHANTKLVGVFMDESVDQIHEICEGGSISIIQLHQERSCEVLSSLLQNYTVFYAVKNQSTFVVHKRLIPLFDSDKKEKSQPFDWFSFVPPKKPWILAGGLTVDNVSTAIRLLNPSIVDVASGVEKMNSVRKDDRLVRQFIGKVRETCFQEKARGLGLD